MLELVEPCCRHAAQRSQRLKATRPFSQNHCAVGFCCTLFTGTVFSNVMNWVSILRFCVNTCHTYNNKINLYSLVLKYTLVCVLSLETGHSYFHYTDLRLDITKPHSPTFKATEDAGLNWAAVPQNQQQSKWTQPGGSDPRCGGLRCAEGSVTLRLQEGAERVVDGGHVQVLQMAAVRLRFRLLAWVVLPAQAGQGLLSPDGAASASLQAHQDHVGKVLLEPLEILPAGKRM